MKVQELINHLTVYSGQSPENSSADVVIKNTDGVCFEMERADDLRGMPGQHFLAFVPNERGVRFNVKEFKKQ